MFRGFVSVDWGFIYSTTDYTPMHVRRERITGQLSKVVLALQDYSIHIWKSRNGILHEAGSQGLESVHASLNDDICQMYGIQENLAPIIQSYFSILLGHRLRTSPRQRQRWLQLVQLATAHSSAQGSWQAIVPSYFPHVHSTGTRIPVPETMSVCFPTLLVPSHQVSIKSYLTSRVMSSSM